MERANPNHPVFKTFPGLVEEIRKAFGIPDDKSMEDTIDQFEEWVKKQNHFTVKRFDRVYLEAYLMTAKGSMEKAKKRLDKRCTLPRMMPELFDNIDIDKDFIDLRKKFKHAYMPYPTSEYYRVVVDRFDKFNDSLNMEAYGRFQHVNAEYNMMNDYTMGYIVVVDLRNITLKDFMANCNPVILQKTMTMLVEGYGAKIKASHVIIESKLVDRIIGFVKQCLSEKMGKRIQVHASPETLTNFIPKECLPSDFGGTQKSIDELDQQLFQQFRSETHKARMKVVKSYSTDESKRLSSKFNEEYMGMPGSFKALSVD